MIPKEGNETLGSSSGAHTNALVVALDPDDYATKVIEAFNEMAFIVKEIEDVNLFEERIECYEVSEEIIRLAKMAKISGKVEIDIFHAYKRIKNDRHD